MGTKECTPAPLFDVWMCFNSCATSGGISLVCGGDSSLVVLRAAFRCDRDRNFRNYEKMAHVPLFCWEYGTMVS